LRRLFFLLTIIIAVNITQWILPVLLAAAFFTALSCSDRASLPTALDSLIPARMAGWQTRGEPLRYYPATLFEYINGASELYLSFDFRECLVRRFSAVGRPDVEAAVFDMGSPPEAFGIFSLEREGADAAVGSGSEYAGGLLRFWKGRYFVCVLTEQATAKANSAVLAIGKEIAARISKEGPPPDIIALLPREGLVPTTVRFFHGRVGLGRSPPMSGKSLRSLDGKTDTVRARYGRGEESLHLIIVHCPGKERAAKAFEELAAEFLQGARGGGPARLKSGRWGRGAHVGENVAFVLDARSEQDAEKIFKRVLRNLERQSPHHLADSAVESTAR
jgi:hypothetical protein